MGYLKMFGRGVIEATTTYIDNEGNAYVSEYNNETHKFDHKIITREELLK